jgi:hypothetical protein
MHRATTSKPFTVALLATALLAMPALAGARVLASGFMISSDAVRLGCRIQNVGTVPVVITSARVVTEAGLGQTQYQDCVGTLQPGTTCSVGGNGNLLSGVVQAEGAARGLRGVCTLLASGNYAIVAVDMR